MDTWYSRQVLAKSVVGNNLWMVVKQTNEIAVSADSPITETKESTLILLCLLERAKEKNEPAEWGYKDMSESMYPYYYDCPKKFLAMAPVANEEWRNKVLAKKAIKMSVGDTVILANGCTPAKLIVSSVKPLRGRDESGDVYRIPRKQIERVESAVVA